MSANSKNGEEQTGGKKSRHPFNEPLYQKIYAMKRAADVRHSMHESMAYTRALSTLQKYPLPIISAAQAGQLEGFGPKVQSVVESLLKSTHANYFDKDYADRKYKALEEEFKQQQVIAEEKELQKSLIKVKSKDLSKEIQYKREHPHEPKLFSEGSAVLMGLASRGDGRLQGLAAYIDRLGWSWAKYISKRLNANVEKLEQRGFVKYTGEDKESVELTESGREVADYHSLLIKVAQPTQQLPIHEVDNESEDAPATPDNKIVEEAERCHSQPVIKTPGLLSRQISKLDWFSQQLGELKQFALSDSESKENSITAYSYISRSRENSVRKVPPRLGLDSASKHMQVLEEMLLPNDEFMVESSNAYGSQTQPVLACSANKVSVSGFATPLPRSISFPTPLTAGVSAPNSQQTGSEVKSKDKRKKKKKGIASGDTSVSEQSEGISSQSVSRTVNPNIFTSITANQSLPPVPYPRVGISSQSILSRLTSSLTLCIDNREKKRVPTAGEESNYFIDKLETLGVKCENRNLPLGDFLWIVQDASTRAVEGTIVERKQIRDLLGSVLDGRYEEQKNRLKLSGAHRVIYIIEGDPKTLSGSDRKTVETAIHTTRVFNKFTVVVTPSIQATVKTLRSIHTAVVSSVVSKAKASIEEGQSTVSYLCTFDDFNQYMRRKDVQTVGSLLGGFVGQLKGFGKEYSEKIRRRFQTMRALCEFLNGPDRDKQAIEQFLQDFTKDQRQRLQTSFIWTE